MADKLPIVWSAPALEDLRSIRDYVALDKPVAAKRLAKRLRESVLRLGDFPESGRRVPELPGTPYREVISPPYRIVYENREDRVVVLRVWHEKRLLTRDKVSRR